MRLLIQIYINNELAEERWILKQDLQKCWAAYHRIGMLSGYEFETHIIIRSKMAAKKGNGLGTYEHKMLSVSIEKSYIKLNGKGSYKQ